MFMRDIDGMELQDRLLRIEAKLDKLTDQLSELGRIDERTDAAHARLNRHEQRLDWVEREHRELVEQFQKQSGSALIWERLGWIIFAALLAIAGQWLK
jgi:predicted nuclease with TOPRIM domain